MPRPFSDLVGKIGIYPLFMVDSIVNTLLYQLITGVTNKPVMEESPCWLSIKETDHISC